MKPALTQSRIDSAIEVAAKVFEVPRREITGRCNMHSVSRARQAVWMALYSVCETSYPELAWRLQRDSSTILVGVRKAEAASVDPDYDDRVRLIKAAALRVCR